MVERGLKLSERVVLGSKPGQVLCLHLWHGVSSCEVLTTNRENCGDTINRNENARSHCGNGHIVVVYCTM